MKFRIIKRTNWDGTTFSIEKQAHNDDLWIHVSDTCSTTEAEVKSKWDYIQAHGEPKDEVIKEVTV